jgi:hypothetical protein
MENNVNFPP